jgi:hypothetical protein
MDKAGLAALIGEASELITDVRMEARYWLNDDGTLHHIDVYVETIAGEPVPMRVVMQGTVFIEPWDGTIEFPPEITGAAE